MASPLIVVSNSKFDIKNLMITLTCPIGMDLLDKAVNLSPCCHKINEKAANEWFEKIINGRPLNTKGCPVCNSKVEIIGPDHTIRSIVENIIGHEADLIQLPQHPLAIEKKEEKANLPYPGISAVFVHEYGDGSNWSDSPPPSNESISL